ncbi:hypothetical protein PGT21_023834 [Puccinia graminis f. sp. tritici]|uniref:Uncharacterized protein n=1 Tax=Puccinia graminis f. sp. tritici TaxID=56615 RepID=A0A5B0NYC0_PUCGR|nr:hypothetical protein PGT21_023834 [Puccinia graminis f. sp. tritici]
MVFTERLAINSAFRSILGIDRHCAKLYAAVTPSHSARHPSNACQSVYSSGLPLDRSPTVASASRCPRSFVAPPQYTLNPSPQSAVNPKVRQCPDFPQQAFRNLAHLACFSPLSCALES